MIMPLDSTTAFVTGHLTREAEAARVVEYRARIMGAGKYATAWGALGARNAVKDGHSAHRAIEIGTGRVVDFMGIEGSRQ